MSQITKRALEESLKHLLLKKPLDKITITDITDDCGVNRMVLKKAIKKIGGTDLEKLLKEYGVI